MVKEIEKDEKTALLKGTVVRAGGGLYEVDVQGDGTSHPEEAQNDGAQPVGANEMMLCTLRGRLKRGKRVTAQPVSVGDSVLVRPLETFGPDARGRRLREGHIEEVLPRHSLLGRSRYNKTDQVTVANLDQGVVVLSMREPDLSTHRLDRFLVLIEASDLQAIICFNKCDLLRKREFKAEVEPLLKLYGGLGYVAIATSEETGLGIDELRTHLQNHISAFVGSSGVGKSSLVNAVQPGLHLWVGDVMEIGKGRHTTTEVSLHPLAGGGYIADTPGIKTVSLLEQEEVNLPQCFPEFQPFVRACRFNDCSHVHEPGCAVREAVENGEIASSRYESYRKILDDMATKGRKI
jgi:ribosome biogenesis GTPase